MTDLLGHGGGRIWPAGAATFVIRLDELERGRMMRDALASDA